uniref:Integrin subunit alpha 10 n=1 Tax=Lepisosteus oculatus TaxID=7918 RepID=W5MH20_LEPOC
LRASVSFSLLGLCLCFNVDVKRPRIFSGPADALFGYSVLQHEAEGQKWMLVGAPWDGPANNRKGDVYKCIVGQERNSNCTKVNLGEVALQNVSRQLRNSHLGMTLSPSRPDGFVACAPLWSQECGTSVFSTGICASVDNSFQPKETIAPTAQSTTQEPVPGPARISHGSRSWPRWVRSMHHSQVGIAQCRTRVFSSGQSGTEIGHTTQVSPVQSCVICHGTSSGVQGRGMRTQPTSASGHASLPRRGKRVGIDPETQRRVEGLSCFPRQSGIWEHWSCGACFLCVIAQLENEPSEKFLLPENTEDERAERDIITISERKPFCPCNSCGFMPVEKHLDFSVSHFCSKLQGSVSVCLVFFVVSVYDCSAPCLQVGLLQYGFSVPDRDRGRPTSRFPVHILQKAPKIPFASFSNCSVGDTWLDTPSLCLPKFPSATEGRSAGRRIPGEGSWRLYNKVSVSQIGSYFGSEVCPVDVNRDGVTDVLLVAAPMYLGSGNKEAGRVYVYTLSRVLFTPNGTLQAHRKAQDARFGYAMAMVPDLNHDGYNDLLVGAPLEDGHRGAVYIYHGYGTSIVPQYKQRIPGSALSPGLQYFGRSVSSRLDLDGDELLDLAVGAQGSAVLLSSRSIVQINVTLSFQPHSINVIHKNCQRGVRESACLNATVCFHTTSRSPGTDRAPFDLHVGAMLDDRKFMTRALFDQSSQRQIQTVLQAQIDEVTCSMLPFHVFDTADYIRPIGFALRFRINDTESGPVLDEGWPTFAKRLIPFFKDCGEDDVCVTDLVLHAHMDVSGSRQEPYIVRSPRRRLAVELVLENRQENAYNTSLRLLFSRNLHFSSLSSKDEPQVKMECTALSSNSHSCNVSYPVFRSQAKVCALCLDCLFLSCVWTLSCVCPSVCFHSDSAEREETLHDNTAQLLAMVLYEPDLFITSDSNLNRYEVHPTRTPSEGIGPEFHTNFKVQNLGCYPVSNLELRVRLPSLAAADGPFLSVSEVTTQNVSGVNCSVLSDPRALRQAQRDVRPVHPGDLQHAEQLECQRASGLTTLSQQNGLLTLTPRQAKFKAVKIFSSHSLAVPESSMLSLGPAGLWRETVLEVLKGRSIPISLWILIGSIIGGLLLLALIIFLLWKLGFFSRKQREEREGECREYGQE